MKKTLLALMLVSSLFVISCGADATKPQDAYKSQTTEIETGTTIGYANNLTGSTGVVDVSTFASAGEKVTEIVQVTTTTTGTKTTNTISAITKNADGGIYQFTISDTAAQSATVTYKYSKKAAAPMTEKETSGTYTSTGALTMSTDFNNDFDKSIVSITDKNGKQLTDRDYTYSDYAGIIITTTTTTYTSGDPFTVRYSSRDINMISEKPITEATTPPQGLGSGTTATIQLDAAANAGKSYYLVATIRQNSPSLINYIKENKIVPSTGAITISAPRLILGC